MIAPRAARLAPLLFPLCAAARPPAAAPNPAAASHTSIATHATPPAGPARASAPDVELAWRVLRLENGLQVVLHHDPGTPEVAVELWLRGGAASDLPGRPGQAHLFEHTGLPAARFFANRENYASFLAVTRDGNAWTGYDFLRFFSQVEPRGVEVALAMMADRLGSRPDALTSTRVERDRNIVLNELRRSHDTRWDPELHARLAAGTYGAGHPYAHARGGSAEGVQAASLDELQEWHRRHVGASNAVLLVAGRFDPARVESLVRRWFGSLPAGTPLAAPASPPPPAPALREVLEKALPAPAVYLSWPLPAWGSEDGDRMALFARVLHDRVERRATSAGSPLAGVEVEVELWSAAGQLTMRADLSSPGAHPAAEALLRDEIRVLSTRGPERAELERARARVRGDFLRGLQRPGWLGGRLEVLGMGMMVRGDPGWYRTRLAHTDSATAADVRDAARRWLGSPGYTLYVVPPGARADSSPAAPDWGATVALPDARPATFPAVHRSVLAGGARLLTVERHELPLVQLTLVVPAGRGTDAVAAAGRARLALDALQQVAVTPPGGTPLPLKDAVGALGGELSAALDDHDARLSLSVPAERADAAAAVLASALIRGPGAEALAAARTQALARVGGGAGDPQRVRTRVLACALGGAGCTPSALDGEGTRASLQGLPESAVRAFYAERWRAGSAVLAISGDVTRTRAQALARTLTTALPPGTVAREDARPADAGRGAVLIVDRPGAQQSHIVLAQALEAGGDPLPAQLLSSVMGGLANQRLREEKQWSYGASSSLEPWEGGQLLRVEAPVQTDRTAEAVAELLAQARALGEGTPVKPDLLAGRRGWLARSVVWSVTSLPELNDRLVELERHGLPADFYGGYLRRIGQAGDAELAAAARALLRPDRFVWVIVGDRAQIEAPLRQLGIGEVRVADVSGLW
ncbi:MAG TPA: insulinase family protein [Longimicrobium sp.]|nr:insulinase family protein [Longimicrobium sp.]